MKERPIPFSAAMVQALLAGRKTQTRRIISPDLTGLWDAPRGPEDYDEYPSVEVNGEHVHVRTRCPYGQPGDFLWVREDWRTGKLLDKYSATKIETSANDVGYKSGPYCPLWYEADGLYRQWGSADKRDFGDKGRLRIARFMPRWASRITLEITGVRVERVQDISEADAIAEGIEGRWHPNASDIWTWRDYARAERFAYGAMWGPRESYRTLWESLHGKDPAHAWAANPWVWCLSFKRVEEQAR